MRIYLFSALLLLSGSLSADLLLPNEVTPTSSSTSTNSMIAEDKQPQADTSRQPKISALEAAELAGKQTPGKIISVDLESSSLQYVVKILHNGHMKTLYVHAIDGKVSRVSD